jgi:hypothetical protein
LTVAELDALIEQIAAEPASASGDGHSATQHNLSELRKLRNDLIAQENARQSGGGAWGMAARGERFAPQHPGVEPG